MRLRKFNPKFALSSGRVRYITPLSKAGRFQGNGLFGTFMNYAKQAMPFIKPFVAPLMGKLVDTAKNFVGRQIKRGVDWIQAKSDSALDKININPEAREKAKKIVHGVTELAENQSNRLVKGIEKRTRAALDLEKKEEKLKNIESKIEKAKDIIKEKVSKKTRSKKSKSGRSKSGRSKKKGKGLLSRASILKKRFKL